MAIFKSGQGYASTTEGGLLALATAEEHLAGIIDNKAASPAGVKAMLDQMIDGAPALLDTLNELAAAIGDDENFAVSTQAKIDNLQNQINTLSGTNLGALTQEIDDIEAGAGLNTDGSYSADTGATYIASATSLKDADSKLDAQVAANAAAISSLGSGNIANLQSEIDSIESSVGIGTDGSFTAQSGNYIGSASSVRGEISALDTQVKTNADAISNLASSSAITSLQSELDATQASVGTNSDGTYSAHSGSNYMDSDTSVKGALSSLDSQIKTNADAIALKADASSLSVYALDSDLTSAIADIASNDTELSDHESRIASLEGASTNQAEVDAIEASVGINTDGTFTANSSGNYISSASSVRGEINLLDSKVKANYDDITSNASDISSLTTTVSGKASTSDLATLQSEVDTTQAAVGLNTDGTYSAHSGSNYIDSATTTKAALGLLDAEISTNATDISNLTSTVNTLSSAGSANASEITALENEIDATQAGAGLSTTGAYTAPGASNYLGSATSLKDADNKLDAQIKTNADAIALKASSSDLSSAEADIATNASNISTNATNISTNATGISDNAADIATNTSDISTNTSSISSLTSTVNGHTTSISDNSSDIASLEALADTHESSIGLSASGAFVANTSGNYIGSASSVRGEINAVDAQVKTNADAIALKASSSDLTTLTGRVSTNESDISALESDVATAQSDISTNAGNISTNTSNISTNTSNISSLTSSKADASTVTALQSEVDATQSGAGLSTSGAYVANGSANYISSATSLKDADNKLDAQVKTNADAIAVNASDIATLESDVATLATSSNLSALQTEVDAIETAAGLSASGAYVAHSGSNYMDSATTMKGAREALDSQVKTNADAIAANDSDIASNASDISGLQTELDATQSGAGLGTDGSYSANSGSNYITTASSLKAADNLLDAQIKTNADAIALKAAQTDVDALETLADAHEAAVGLAANGTFVAYSGTNYLDSTTTIAGAIEELDTQIKTRQDNIDSEASARASADTALQGKIDTVEASVGLQTDGSLSITGTNFLNSATSVVDGLDILDTNVNYLSQVQGNIRTSAGLSSTGTLTAYSSTNYISGSLKAAIEALDTQVKSNADSISGLGGSDIANLQSELDDTQSSVGLDADGLYVDRSGSNYIDSANNIAQEIGLLDAAVKDNEDEIALKANSTTVSALDLRVTQLEIGDGGILLDHASQDAVEMDATLSEFKSHSGPFQISFASLVSSGTTDLVLFGSKGERDGDRHFAIHPTTGDAIFVGKFS